MVLKLISYNNTANALYISTILFLKTLEFILVLLFKDSCV